MLGVAAAHLGAGLGTVLGSITWGRLADVWGRKHAFIWCIVVLVVFTAASAFTPVNGWVLLAILRTGVGFGVGGLNITSVPYVQEFVPAKQRGLLSGLTSVFIPAGIFLGGLVTKYLGAALGWRGLIAIGCIPIVLLAWARFIPESPRFLQSKGREEEALKILDSLRPEGRAKPELAEIEAASKEEAGRVNMTISEIFSNKNLVRILLIGCGIGFFQQTTGINSILYYGEKVLEESGFSTGAALIANIAPATISVIAAIVALQMMDRFSRRKTFMWGYGLVAITHVLIATAAGLLPESDAKPFVLLALIVFFVGAMQLCLNVATWVTLSEIFPLKMRAFGMGLSVFVLWMTNSFLGLFFASVIASIGLSMSFVVFAVLNAIAFVFVLAFVPETKGRTLEQLETDVMSGEIFKHGK